MTKKLQRMTPNPTFLNPTSNHSKNLPQKSKNYPTFWARLQKVGLKVGFIQNLSPLLLSPLLFSCRLPPNMTSAPLSSLGAIATLLLLDQPTTMAPATLPQSCRRHRQAAAATAAISDAAPPPRRHRCCAAAPSAAALLPPPCCCAARCCHAFAAAGPLPLPTPYCRQRRRCLCFHCHHCCYHRCCFCHCCRHCF